MEVRERTGPDEDSTQESQRTLTRLAFLSLASLLLPIVFFPGLIVFENELRELLTRVPATAATEIIAVTVDAELPDMDSLLAEANVAQSNEALHEQVLKSLNMCWIREGQQRPAVKLGFHKLAMGRCLATTPPRSLQQCTSRARS